MNTRVNTRAADVFAGDEQTVSIFHLFSLMFLLHPSSCSSAFSSLCCIWIWIFHLSNFFVVLNSLHFYLRYFRHKLKTCMRTGGLKCTECLLNNKETHVKEPRSQQGRQTRARARVWREKKKSQHKQTFSLNSSF